MHGVHLFLSVPFCDVEARNFRNCNCVWISGDQLDLISSADFPFFCDGKVETGPAAGQESFHHIIRLKSDTQFVAGQARLCHDYFSRTNGKMIAQMDCVLQQAIGREIFSKHSHRQLSARQLFLPVGVVLEGVAVDGLVHASVNTKVGLTVAVQIELA